MARSTALVAAGAVALLLAAAPSPITAARLLTRPELATSLTDPLVAAVALLAWGLAAWLLLTVLLTAGTRLGGPLGRACGGVLRRAAPAAVRRAVALALGVGVVLGTPGLASAAPAPSPAATAAQPASAGPSLDWPVLAGPATAPTTAPTTAPVPAPAAPRAAGDVVVVVVERGDSLWRLAARHLPADASDADIAAAWPSWWAANRQLIGEDPGLLQPGQRLTVPAADAPGAR